MKKNPEFADIGTKSKRWTKQNLHPSDYAFAQSEKGEECLATQLWKSKRSAAKSLVAAMIDWELFRELNLPGCHECKRKPYLEIPEHRARIDAILKSGKPTRIIPPLKEIPLAEVPAWAQTRDGIDDGSSIHAFEIGRDDDTSDTVARFKKWLVAFKQTPDSRGKAPQAIKAHLSNRGALRYDATLRALAVRRLKLAGYTREQTEKLLCLKKYALNPRLKANVTKPQAGEQAIGSGTDQWAKLPALAERSIQKLLNALRQLYPPSQ